MALWKNWADKGFVHPLRFFRTELLPVCKVSGSNTYYRALRDLNDYGYLNYIPSFSHYHGSLVYFHPPPGQLPFMAP